ncbi:uncharacterized protein LOC129596066 isoform X2 [Paramacrobiotus metropolitanus]|nr:uncharacterized protein LOC129596066 isoform X2 [Paramacrobiotus metropolitanus]
MLYIHSADAGNQIWCRTCVSSKESPECEDPIKLSDVSAPGANIVSLTVDQRCDRGCAQQVYSVYGQIQYVSFGCAGVEYAPYGLDMDKCGWTDSPASTNKSGRIKVVDCLYCDEDFCNDPTKNSPVPGAPNSWRKPAAPAIKTTSTGKKRQAIYPINLEGVTGNLTLDLTLP